MKKFKKNEKYGLMDDNKNIIIHPKYDWIEFFYNGFVRYKINGKWGFIDSNGNEIIPPKYNWLDVFKEGFAKCEIKNKYGFIDTNGNEITKPLFEWKNVAHISNHSNNILWGYKNIIFKNYSIYLEKIKIVL